MDDTLCCEAPRSSFGTAHIEGFLDPLLFMAKSEPNRVLFTYVGYDGQDKQAITAAELVAAANGVAKMLPRWGLSAGDRALLIYPSGIDFIVALVGCMAAGVIPVPVYPLNPFQLSQGLAAFSAIVANCGAKVALTNGEYSRLRTIGQVSSLFKRDKSEWPEVAWRRTDNVSAAAGACQWVRVADPQAPAFLQYTSGSTGTPKGVVITHGNLRHELASNANDLGLNRHSRLVCWVPLYHDLGLISGICSGLFGNGHLYFMSPLAFISQPTVWFDVLSRVKATHTAAPNFALELITRKTTPEMRKRWNLSSLEVVMSAAEPIRASTVRNFLSAFAMSRLRPDCFYPAYGLAEHTVSVTMGGRAIKSFDQALLERGRAVPVLASYMQPTVTLVGCGFVTKPDAKVLIVDPETRQTCGSDQVGEIWVNSATKGGGYYGMPEESRQTFRARLAANEDDGTEFLRTGDLGFFHGGELFVAGRLKDLIIVRGRNIYPPDLEDSVRDCHPQIRPGGVACFAINDAGDQDEAERIVLLLEVRNESLKRLDAKEVVAAARQKLLDTHQLHCDIVVVGKPGLVLKTTSGKVRRRSCKQAYLAGETARSTKTLHIAPGNGAPPSHNLRT